MKNKPYDPEFQKTKQQLYYIFTYYCSFADRENYEILKIQNFRRLLTDAQLIQKNYQNSQFDLLYSQCKKNNSGIDYDTFLQIIPEIGKIVEPNQSSNAVKRIVNQNFHALYQFIMESTDFGASVRYLDKAYFSENCYILLRTLSPTIYKIYSSYFDPKAIKAAKQRAQIFKKLTNFTKNFEITPQMMTKTESFIIFNHILDQEAESVYKQWFQEDNKNMQIFKYFHFLKYILIVSLVASRKLIQVQLSQLRKLVNLLQIFEISNGFNKICKMHQINLHLIPNQKLIKQLEYTGITQLNIPSLKSSPTKKQAQNSQPSINDKFLQNYSQLRKKFISFCLHGETIGNSFLTHKKAIDIIKAMKLGLKQSQIQVYLASAGKSLQFQSFILMFQKISEKQIIEVEELIEKFLKLALNEQIQHEILKKSRINSNFSRTQYRNCISMIQFAQSFLKTAFILQSAPAKQLKEQLTFISLSGYLKIMHDFQISPLYLSKQSLIEIFRISIKKSYDFMNFNEFKDSFVIAIPYLDLQYKQNQQNFSPETKMIVIFERINQSRGAKKVSRTDSKLAKQDYLIKFRHNFKQFYPQQLQSNKNGEQKLRYILQ